MVCFFYYLNKKCETKKKKKKYCNTNFMNALAPFQEICPAYLAQGQTDKLLIECCYHRASPRKYPIYKKSLILQIWSLFKP